MARRMSSHVPAIEGFCVCSDIVSTQESPPQDLRRTCRGEREKFDRKLRSSKNPRGNHLNCRKRELFDGEENGQTEGAREALCHNPPIGNHHYGGDTYVTSAPAFRYRGGGFYRGSPHYTFVLQRSGRLDGGTSQSLMFDVATGLIFAAQMYSAALQAAAPLL